MADRAIIVIMILGVIGLGLLVGGGGFVAGQLDNWSPRNYTAKPGDCFVPPQGDPLYDSYYAKEVNVPNCSAFEGQAKAHQIEEDTRRVRAETNFGIVGGYATITIFALVIGLIVVMLLKG